MANAIIAADMPWHLHTILQQGLLTVRIQPLNTAAERNNNPGSRHKGRLHRTRPRQCISNQDNRHPHNMVEHQCTVVEHPCIAEAVECTAVVAAECTAVVAVNTIPVGN